MTADQSKEFALFLEKLRFLRGISQEEFTEGIISNRQYQRYVRGESPMPFHLLKPFAEKLNITKEVLLVEFENDSNNESYTINKLLSAIFHNDKEQTALYKEQLNPNFIHQPENKTLLKFGLTLEKLYNDEITQASFRIACLELIDYDKTLSRTAISLNESLILLHLIGTNEGLDDLKIIKKIEQFLQNPDLIWTGNQIVTYSLIYFTLAKFFGKHENYKKTIYYCDQGIKMNKNTKTIHNLENYYYFMALSYYRIENHKLFTENLYKCFCALIITENPSKIEYYSAIIKKDFNLELKSFIIDYLSKEV